MQRSRLHKYGNVSEHLLLEQMPSAVAIQCHKTSHSCNTHQSTIHAAACLTAEMAQDTEHEQSLQERADALVAEQHALQKRLMQLQQELAAEAEAVQQLTAGE